VPRPEIRELLETRFAARITQFRGENTFTLEPDRLIAALTALKERRYALLATLHGVDYLDYPGHGQAHATRPDPVQPVYGAAPPPPVLEPGQDGKPLPRYGVVYSLVDPYEYDRLWLRVLVDGDPPRVPSATAVFPGASYPEREVYDLYGVIFDGHADLRRILTPDDLEGHALRKDYPLGETPVQFGAGRFLDPAEFRAALDGLRRRS
jgi:NADH:ubiquinone oxidoreductase subunit C